MRRVRWWALTLVGAAAGASLAYVARSAIVSAPNDPAPSGPKDTSSTVECIPWHQPGTVADINRQVGNARRFPGFLGADVGASVELSDGRGIFVFGDTLLSEQVPGPTFIHNSMLVIGPGCASAVLPDGGGAVFPDRADGVFYWPMSIDKRVHGDVDFVGVGLLRLRRTGDDMFDFEVLGSSVAELRVPRGGRPTVLGIHDLGRDRVDDGRPAWGAAVTVTDRWIYVYGTSNPDPSASPGWALHVARTRPSSLLDPSGWQYWSDDGWAGDQRGLATLIPSDGGVSRVLSVFQQDGSWYAVSKRDDFVGRDLVVWKAPGPTGPFVAGPSAARIPSAAGVLQYMPLAHTHLLPKPGTVVVSWSRNVADLEEIKTDPTLYRPEFARIDLP